MFRRAGPPGSLSFSVRLADTAMAQSPTPPYFSYNREHHRIEFSETVENHLEVPLRNIVRGPDVSWITYDASGLTWSFRYLTPAGGFPILTRLLAHPIFGGFLFLRAIPITWTKGQTYPLSELRDTYLRCIQQDDGWLTRFVDETELERGIRTCETFGDLVLTWRSTKTETPDDVPQA
jgi:hypothetical protein